MFTIYLLMRFSWGREYEEGMEDCSGGIDYIIAVFDFF